MTTPVPKGNRDERVLEVGVAAGNYTGKIMNKFFQVVELLTSKNPTDSNEHKSPELEFQVCS